MREHARNYAIYLRRRAEDFAEPDRPIPKWSDLDHEAVKVVLDEFDRLQHANVVANEALRKNGITTSHARISSGDRVVRFDSDIGWKLVLLAIGVTSGAFIREVGSML